MKNSIYNLMDKGMTYDEAYEELAYQADCEHDRQRDDDLTERADKGEP